MKILIVDDNPLTLNLLRKVLENLKHRVMEADNGKTGLKMILDNKIDLVFLDWQMPEMDGLEVLESLKRENNQTLIAMMTAFPNLKVSVKAFTLGIINFIVKPQTHEDIVYSLEIAQIKLYERKQVEIAKKRVIDAQRSKNTDRVKYLFLSFVNHELRTPLSELVGISEQIPKGIACEQYSKVIDFSNHLKFATSQLTDSIENILDYLQLDIGELNFNSEVSSIEATLDQIIPLFQALADQKRIHLEIDISNNVPPIIIDPARLIQIIKHLFSNAIKFTPEEGTIRIELLYNQHVNLKIVDSGLGFNSSELQKIFNPFERFGHAETEQQGLGVGLTLTKALVELQGGSIIAQSEPNKGSVFTLSFPAAKHHKSNLVSTHLAEQV
ncbi:MAG: hybrid sensor histidine kinase/response regulator [Proteobacteria bacterium]|nr:hybrid sensor histidine kinase/response regulator [Pseudomonadota bacterium]